MENLELFLLPRSDQKFSLAEQRTSTWVYIGSLDLVIRGADVCVLLLVITFLDCSNMTVVR